MKAIVSILIGIITINTALSCDCIPMSFADEVKASSSIFHGRVTKAHHHTFDIEIIQMWKGDAQLKNMQIVQGRTGCEKRMFELGKEYIFYLQGDNSVYLCSRTEEYEISIDTELLELAFNHAADKNAIESSHLTGRQLVVLKKIFDRHKIAYPSNIGEIPLRYAVENKFVKKLNFFENTIWFSSKIKLEKMTDVKQKNKGDTYVLWIGYDWKKSMRKLQRALNDSSS